MKFLVDMNLSPELVEVLERLGDEAAHWSTIGDPRAKDAEIMAWARDNGYVVFTHDLDFGALLATTGAEGPSVIPVRTQDVTPSHLDELIAKLLQVHRDALERGALAVVDEAKNRVRILPLLKRR